MYYGYVFSVECVSVLSKESLILIVQETKDEKEIFSQTQFKVNLQKMTEIGGNMVKGWYDRNWWECGINNIF